MKNRTLAAVITATVIFGAVSGLAAGVDVTSAQLGSGNVPVSTCDSNGVTTQYTISLGLVTAVVVGAIEDGSATVGSGACDGSVIYVEVLNSGGSVITGGTGNATHTGDTNTTADSRSVSLATPVLAALVANVRITIIG